MIAENTDKLNDLDNDVVNFINQLKKWKKRADVDAILSQIIKKMTVFISLKTFSQLVYINFLNIM